MISNFQSVFHSIENGYDLRYYREGYANVTEKKNTFTVDHENRFGHW